MKVNYEKLLEISNELLNSGWEIKTIDFSSSTILVSKYYALISIYANVYEKRLSLTDQNNTSCYRYCELENQEEMTPAVLRLINEFRHENYRLSIINEFGQQNGHDDIREFYFPDEKSLLRQLVGEQVDDENIYSLKERTHQYPNPVMKLVLKRLKDDRVFKKNYWQFKDSLVFEMHHIEYERENDSYNAKVLDKIKEDRVYYACITIKE
jgi:hypothetical protein